MPDPYNLERFVRAQDSVFEDVRSELQGGVKVGHWMWFIFPQMKGLGTSEMSIAFAISSREEAEAYLKHPVIGPRLKECTRLVLASGNSATEIFGYVDEKKFRSSMTLFAQVSTDDKTFEEALQKYFDGVPDAWTLELL